MARPDAPALDFAVPAGPFPADLGDPARRLYWDFLALDNEDQNELVKWTARHLGFVLVADDANRMQHSQAVTLVLALHRLAGARQALRGLSEEACARLLKGTAHRIGLANLRTAHAWIGRLIQRREASAAGGDAVLEARRSAEERGARHA